MGLGAYRAYWLNDDMEGVLLQNWWFGNVHEPQFLKGFWIESFFFGGGKVILQIFSNETLSKLPTSEPRIPETPYAIPYAEVPETQRLRLVWQHWLSQ